MMPQTTKCLLLNFYESIKIIIVKGFFSKLSILDKEYILEGLTDIKGGNIDKEAFMIR